MSTPAQIIADHQYVPDGRMLGTRCTNITCDWFVPASTSFADMLVSYGAHVVAVLTNAGKTIVELPEAIDEDGQKVWLPAMTEVIAGVEPGRAYVASTIGMGEYDAAKLRELAAVLLAAARVAEGGER